MKRSIIATATAAALILSAGATVAIANAGGQAADTHAATARVANCSEYDGGTAPTGAIVGGACYLGTEYHGSPTLDTVGYGTDIPRCASDDWNSTHVPRCYTERVTDGAVLIIDQTDTVIATLTA